MTCTPAQEGYSSPVHCPVQPTRQLNPSLTEPCAAHSFTAQAARATATLAGPRATDPTGLLNVLHPADRALLKPTPQKQLFARSQRWGFGTKRDVSTYRRSFPRPCYFTVADEKATAGFWFEAHQQLSRSHPKCWVFFWSGCLCFKVMHFYTPTLPSYLCCYIYFQG